MGITKTKNNTEIAIDTENNTLSKEEWVLVWLQHQSSIVALAIMIDHIITIITNITMVEFTVMDIIFIVDKDLEMDTIIIVDIDTIAESVTLLE